MPTLIQAAPDMNGSPTVGVYLTNGIFLYRVAGLLADVDDGFVEGRDAATAARGRCTHPMPDRPRMRANNPIT